MNTVLWILQGLLAAMFLMTGVMKITQPIDKLVKTVTWVDRFSLSTVRFIGTIELLAAIGLILPWLLRIMPMLTPAAAIGLATVQFLAIFHHARHKEGKTIVLNIILLLIAAFIAYGRLNG
jgi:uncharacterized membrane protein YphA (DoxX/SURF4 family)